MSLIPSRGLIRASKNPDCELLAAMAIEGADERKMHEAVIGPFLGEYGERASARRRGAQFENRNHENDAAVLKAKLGPLVGRDPDDMSVRNFAEEHPGPPHQLHSIRLWRVREIFRDLAAGRSVPDILIQPTLAIDVLPGAAGALYLSPDFMVFDRGIGSYRLGEEKSFIVRRRNVEPGDLDSTRRQCAAGILALKDELRRAGLAVPSDHLALFLFATPYGMNAAEPYEELLRAEISEIDRARMRMRDAAQRLVALRAQMQTTQLSDLVDDLGVNFRESCISSCLMNKYCEKRNGDSATIYGDAAARALGSIAPSELPRLIAADPAELSAHERYVRSQLRECADALGISHDELQRMIA